MKKVFIILLIVFISMIFLAVLSVGAIAVIFGVTKNVGTRNTIEETLEKRYNKDFEIVSTERVSRELKGVFFQKFRDEAVVKDKTTNKKFSARKNEDDNKVEDKYYEVLYGDSLKSKLNKIISKNSKFKFVDKNQNGYFSNNYTDKGYKNEQDLYKNNLIFVEATIETNETSTTKIKEDVYNLCKDLENEGFCYKLYVCLTGNKSAYVVANFSVSNKKITESDISKSFSGYSKYWDEAHTKKTY